MPQVASLYLNADEKKAFVDACNELKLTPYAAIKEFALELIKKHEEKKKVEPESGSGTEGRGQETVKVSY